MQYRKKPVVIEAKQLTEDSIGECLSWITDYQDVEIATNSETDEIVGLFIGTLEGQMLASMNDWIIKGVQGEFYPCKPEIFEKTYEPVN